MCSSTGIAAQDNSHWTPILHHAQNKSTSMTCFCMSNYAMLPVGNPCLKVVLHRGYDACLVLTLEKV
jgi:hypothetical protein